MRTIKTRSAVKNIKVLDKGVNLSKRMKDAYVQTKERAEETQNTNHATPTEYAGDHMQGTAQEVARDTVSYFSNHRQKAAQNWNRAKGHWGEVQRNLPQERRRAAEQAQKTAHKVKATAENLRKTADSAGETARDAKAAVKDAKQNFREVRQQGRQTLREVRQKVRTERGGRTIKTKGYAANTPASELPRPASNGVNPALKDGAPRPTYLNKGVKSPKSAGGPLKPLQTPAKSTGKAFDSTRKGFKETAKGTIRTAKKSVKTAEQSAKAAVKTAQRTAKAAQKTAKTAAKTAQAAERAARAAAKTAMRTAKAAARAVAALVKIAIAAIKGLVAVIAAGGWMAVFVILIICMIGLLVGSVFGIFFSSESGASDNGMTMRAVVSQINTEFAGELARIQRENPHDSCEITANRALWKDILAVYAVKTNTDPNNPLDVMTLDDGKIELLRAVFWDMNVVDYWTEEVEHPDTDGDDDEDDSWVEHILHITVTGKTAAEMAQKYGFNAEQRDMMEELLKPEYDELWASLLAGVPSGGGSVTISLGIYIWPSNDSDYVNSFFGTRRHPITGEIDNHTGIDINTAYGTEVLAAADGTVTLAKWNGDYGNCVIIDHGDGNQTLYAHMSAVDVRVGDAVAQGQAVGLVGSTGTSTGPHIHFETIVNGSPVDPLMFFERYEAGW
jgi:murein DD-endopeptidase MepM/ murein hydrolase activator NlpD